MGKGHIDIYNFYICIKILKRFIKTSEKPDMMLTKAKKKKKNCIVIGISEIWTFLILKQREYCLHCLGSCSKMCIFNKIESYFQSKVILFHEYIFHVYIVIFSIQLAASVQPGGYLTHSKLSISIC